MCGNFNALLVQLAKQEYLVGLEVVTNGFQRGIDLANDICKSHRREGKFFDEILEDALKGEK